MMWTTLRTVNDWLYYCKQLGGFFTYNSQIYYPTPLATTYIFIISLGNSHEGQQKCINVIFNVLNFKNKYLFENGFFYSSQPKSLATMVERNRTMLLSVYNYNTVLYSTNHFLWLYSVWEYHNSKWVDSIGQLAWMVGNHRRRIKTAGRAKVVDVGWGTYLKGAQTI